MLAYVDKDSDGEELIPVSEDDIPKIFPGEHSWNLFTRVNSGHCLAAFLVSGAYKACAEQDVELIDSAVVLTLQGQCCCLTCSAVCPEVLTDV